VIKSYHSQVSQEYLYNAAQLIEQRLAAGDDFAQAAQAISSVYQRDGESIRVTVIQTDGTVTYDNLSDSTQMENHLYRPEIRAALQNQGVGFARRTSETIGKQMLYLATYAPALNLVVRTSISYDIERSGYLGLVTTLLIVAGLSMVALLVMAISPCARSRGRSWNSSKPPTRSSEVTTRSVSDPCSMTRAN
jgi:two-component system phosphate regulon sensor histidine kinase PhoR